jgi:hypothetical protein
VLAGKLALRRRNGRSARGSSPTGRSPFGLQRATQTSGELLLWLVQPSRVPSLRVQGRRRTGRDRDRRFGALRTGRKPWPAPAGTPRRLQVRESGSAPGCRGDFWIVPAASSQPATTESRRGATWPTAASLQLSSLSATQAGRCRRSSLDAGAAAPAAVSGCSRIGERSRGPWSDPSAGSMGSARRVVLVQRRPVSRRPSSVKGLSGSVGWQVGAPATARRRLSSAIGRLGRDRRLALWSAGGLFGTGGCSKERVGGDDRLGDAEDCCVGVSGAVA